ncbi:Ig-like domain-containing protein [Deinococcus aluminii]|uniref:Ig-like domain-containing protein n=1 Tax=Deinococcus aluminii TaxID=1656885 RepID=A0ABP9XC80_9DEIO
MPDRLPRPLHRSPVLWLLTAALTACGGGGTPAAGENGSNKLPEIVVRGPEGKALTADSYIASGESLTLNVSDLDGSIKKVSYVIDRGTGNERGGDLTPAGKITLPLPPLAGGPHTLVVTATDNAGGVGTAEAAFRIDAAAPTLGGITLNGKAITPGSTTTLSSGDAAALQVSASDTRGDAANTPAPVTLRILEGTQVRASGSGSVSADLSKNADGSARTAGTATFTIEAQDSVGHITRSTFTLNFLAATGGETTTPTFTWLAPTSGYVNGRVPVQAQAVRNGVDLSSSISYSVTCGAIETGSGQATWALGPTCTDGSQQTITATVSDGGKTYTARKTVTVDSSAPTVQITGPQAGQTFTQNPVTVSVVATDALSGVERVVVEASSDGDKTYRPVGVVTGAEGSVTWAPTNGTYTLRATVTDRAGNKTETTLGQVLVALTSSSAITPDVPSVSAKAQASSNPVYVRGLGSLTGSATSTSGLLSGQLLVDGQTQGTPTAATDGQKVSFSLDFDAPNVTEGLHDLGIRWNDKANATVDSPKVSVFVDRTAPTVQWNTPTSGTVINSAPINLNATATDAASGVASVTYSVNGQAVPDTWQPASEGSFTVTATATDKVGNTGTQTTTVTYDKTGPVITATSPANGQEFSTAPVTISATASDNLTGVSSIEAMVTAPDGQQTTLGRQQRGSYSAQYTPVKAGLYTVTFQALDAAGNAAQTTTRTFTYSVTAPPIEKAPAPVLAVVGASPYTGNMSVNVSGNFDTGSQVDRMVLQITDSKGVIDNTTYITSQAQASFSVDTTKFANGDLKLQVIAYTKTGLRGTSDVTTVQVKNIINPVIAVAAPSNGATATTPTVQVRVTITKSGDTNYAFDPASLIIDLLDYRGQLLERRTTTTLPQEQAVKCLSSADGATHTCDTSFDMAGMPADTYTIRATAQAVVDGALTNPQPLKTESKFTSNTVSVNPPASVIRFPVTITNINNIREPAKVDSSSGFFATVSDNVAVQYVEARIVGPFNKGNIESDGTKQCQASGNPVGSPIDVLLVNIPGAPLLPYQTQDVFVPSLDLDGSTYVPNNLDNQRYDLRVTVADNEGNRNIQCVPVIVDRNGIYGERNYTTSTSTTPDQPDTTPGKLTYTSGTWLLNGIHHRSRITAVFYAKGVQVGTSFEADVTGSYDNNGNFVPGTYRVSQTFSEPGTYEVKWLVEDMTTGVVTTKPGGVINVAQNPK